MRPKATITTFVGFVEGGDIPVRFRVDVIVTDGFTRATSRSRPAKARPS